MAPMKVRSDSGGTPAKAGVQRISKILDSSLGRNDGPVYTNRTLFLTLATILGQRHHVGSAHEKLLEKRKSTVR